MRVEFIHDVSEYEVSAYPQPCEVANIDQSPCSANGSTDTNHVSSTHQATHGNSGPGLFPQPGSGDVSASTVANTQSDIVGQAATTTQSPAPATPTECFDLESQITPARPAVRAPLAAFHEGHKFALRTTGALFAVAFFSLKVWGMIDGLVQEE